MPNTIHIPGLRSIARYAAPTVVECKLVPFALFLGLLVVSIEAAILVTLAWNGAVFVRRRKSGRIPGMFVLGLVALAVRSVFALATGNPVMYFLQPTLRTFVIGLAFLVSVPLGKPLAERLTLDVFPLDDHARAHPALRQFLAQVSLIWAATSMANFVLTVWMLYTQPVGVFMVAKSILGPATTLLTLVIALAWFRYSMSRKGVLVVWGQRPQPILATLAAPG